MNMISVSLTSPPPREGERCHLSPSLRERERQRKREREKVRKGIKDKTMWGLS